MQDFLPLLVRLQDEPIADNVCIPLYFLAKLVKDSGTTVVQVGEGADENFLGYWWCEHYRQNDEAVYQPARQRQPAWRRIAAALSRRAPRCRPKRSRCSSGRAGRGTVLGRRRLLVGTEAGAAHAGSPRRSAQAIDCPVEGLLPASHRSLDSHAVVRDTSAPLDGRLDEPDAAAEDAVPGDEASPVRSIC